MGHKTDPKEVSKKSPRRKPVKKAATKKKSAKSQGDLVVSLGLPAPPNDGSWVLALESGIWAWREIGECCAGNGSEAAPTAAAAVAISAPAETAVSAVAGPNVAGEVLAQVPAAAS